MKVGKAKWKEEEAYELGPPMEPEPAPFAVAGTSVVLRLPPDRFLVEVTAVAGIGVGVPAPRAAGLDSVHHGGRKDILGRTRGSS